tara:strand:+ start:75 stop:527 length:453 start_codon:yes stop_codon:yes gene_type:complete
MLVPIANIDLMKRHLEQQELYRQAARNQSAREGSNEPQTTGMGMGGLLNMASPLGRLLSQAMANPELLESLSERARNAGPSGERVGGEMGGAGYNALMSMSPLLRLLSSGYNYLTDESDPNATVSGAPRYDNIDDLMRQHKGVTGQGKVY